MTAIRSSVGSLQGAGLRFGIVASRFNQRLVDPLVQGATDCLERHGVSSEGVYLVRVPGAWEIPLALEELAQRGDFQGLVALGVVIRGETAHFDYICSEAARGCSEVSLRHRVPIGFGLLTCEDSRQAEERAGGKAGNKGWEAAEAALEMANLLAGLRGRS